MITLEIKRYFISEQDGTEIQCSASVNALTGSEAKAFDYLLNYKFELPDFLEPWREMTDAEAKDYQGRQDDTAPNEAAQGDGMS